MGNIYFTSDLHFGHNRDFIFGPRGFTNVQAHDETIIKNWNALVQPDDTVYILGDIMLNDNVKGVRNFNRLNGTKFIILGNHDTKERKEIYKTQLANTTVIGNACTFKYGKYNFYLSHYPTITSNNDDEKPLVRKVINLFGHTHQKINSYADQDAMYHVGLDSHDNEPVEINDIIMWLENHHKEFIKKLEKKNTRGV